MLLSKSRILLALALMLVSAAPAMAAEISAETKSAIAATLDKLMPAEAYTDITESPLPGLYKVTISGGAFLFVTADGQYVVSGELYQVADDRVIHLSEDERKGIRKAKLKEVTAEDVIAFSPKGKTRAVLYVFTDVDCGYCQKLHQEVPQLTEKGVEVRYLAFPRSGLASVGYAKIATAWCDKNPQQALTDIKSGKKLALNVCEDNSVAKDYQLGVDMGVQGTPALLLADGTMIPGYKPAAELLEILGLE